MRYLRLDSSASSMTYSTGVSTPARSGAVFSKKATVRSLPGMNSSTSTPAGNRASCFSTNARSRDRSSITDSWVMLVEERGVERLAEPPPAALGGVEDEVGRERLEARGGAAGGPAHLDALDAVAEPLQGRGERVDGLARIELGFFLGIREAQVVRQGDAHASSGGPAFARSTATVGVFSPAPGPRAAGPAVGAWGTFGGIARGRLGAQAVLRANAGP